MFKTASPNISKTNPNRSGLFQNGRESDSFIQPKLDIGKAGDAYEVEADRVADTIVARGNDNSSTFFSPAPTIQRQTGEEDIQEKCAECENGDNQVQQKPLLETITPLVRRQAEEEPLQEKGLRPNENNEIQKRSLSSSNAGDTSSLESNLNRSKGGGTTLEEPIKNEMEGGFGTDFSQVRIHNDGNAVQMNQQLGAQAFTHGNDIFFNEGNYDPQDGQGKHLLAHELTHTVQQNGTVSKKDNNKIGRTNYNVQGGFLDTVKSVGSSILSGVKSLAGYDWNLLKSAGAWVFDLITMAPARIWRILTHIGSSALNNLAWVWEGITSGLGYLKGGAERLFPWVKEGVFGLFSWIWGGLQAGENWAWKIWNGDFSGFWAGIGNSFLWLGEGAAKLASWGWEGLRAALIWVLKGDLGIAKWLGRGLIKDLASIGRLITKLLDLVGFGEIADLLFNFVKFNTRTLTAAEEQEARKVFDNSISYWQVRIDEFSLIAAIGAFIYSSKNMGVTLFHTINFNHKINASPGNRDMAWLIHELVHVSQYEHVGSQYIGEAAHAQATVGYKYGGGAALVGKDLKDFNREQQGDIIRDYYFRVLYGSSSYATEYKRMQRQLVAGEL